MRSPIRPASVSPTCKLWRFLRAESPQKTPQFTLTSAVGARKDRTHKPCPRGNYSGFVAFGATNKDHDSVTIKSNGKIPSQGMRYMDNARSYFLDGETRVIPLPIRPGKR